MNLHEELHRLVLRKRWMAWSRKNHRPGDYRMPDGRHILLSARLTQWAPIWNQRQEHQKEVLP